MTRFRVLGPVAVDRSPMLRAQMERRLLAALLCRPNAVVSIEDLLMALWGEQEPPTACKTLQVHIRRLRTTLGEDRFSTSPAATASRSHPANSTPMTSLNWSSKTGSATPWPPAAKSSQAHDLWEQAAAIYTELNHPKAEEVLAKLGST